MNSDTKVLPDRVKYISISRSIKDLETNEYVILRLAIQDIPEVITNDRR